MNEQQLTKYGELANSMAGNVVTIGVAYKSAAGSWELREESLDLDDVAIAIDDLVEEVCRLRVIVEAQEAQLRLILP